MIKVRSVKHMKQLLIVAYDKYVQEFGQPDSVARTLISKFRNEPETVSLNGPTIFTILRLAKLFKFSIYLKWDQDESKQSETETLKVG